MRQETWPHSRKELGTGLTLSAHRAPHKAFLIMESLRCTKYGIKRNIPERQTIVESAHLISASTFSQGARDYAASIENKIVLIDGEELAGLMIDYGVGVSTTNHYEIKRIDFDYFEET